MTKPAPPNPKRYVDSPFGAHRAPVTEPATTFAHGRLRASHAVCLRRSTLEPAICARKEAADIECVSTTGGVLAEGFVMRGDFSDTRTASFGFYATSRHCIPRLSSRKSNLNAITANNGAAENCSASRCASRWLLLPPSPPAAFPQPARRAPARSAVSELESLAF